MDTLSIVLWSVIGLVSTIYLFFKKKFSYWKDRGVTYAEPNIPFGNIKMKSHFVDVFSEIYKKKDSSPFIGGYLFTRPIVVPTNLDFVQNILVKDFSSFHARGMYVNEADDPLSANMFSLDGARWKSIRTKLSPTFTSGKMKFMFPTIVDVANRFQEIMTSIVKTKAELDCKELLARFTTDVIGTCAFGIECNSLKDPNAAFRYYGRKVFEEPNLNPFMQFFVVQYPELARKMHVRASSKDVSDFFMSTIRETVDYREKNNVKRNDFVDLLIQVKNGSGSDESSKNESITFEELAAQAFLFYVAGFETSSTAMTFCLYELALNQDIQNRARQEVNEVLEKHEGKLTYEAVKEMTYIDQIINESLRKYPPAVFLIRKCMRDFKIPNSKVTIEKGTEICIPAYSIHRDPEIYHDPETFDPDRFLVDEVKKRHPMSFLGFGDGPRNCIGLRFGRMQARVGLITLLKNYRFERCAKTTVPMKFSPGNLVLSPINGMFLSVEQV